jgi:hypothetical protein
MRAQALNAFSFIFSLFWNILVLVSFPLLAFFSYRGYCAVFPSPQPSLVDDTRTMRRQALWYLLWLLAIVASAVTWFKALDRRLMEFVVSILEALGFTPPY